MTISSGEISILIISRNLSYSLSAPKCSFNLTKSLLKLGINVHILTSHAEPELIDDLRRLGGVIHFVKPLYSSRTIAPIFLSLYAKALKSKFRINLVIGNGYTINDDITWVHFPRYGWIEALTNVGEQIPKKLKFEAFAERILFLTSKYLLAVSNLVKDILVKYYDINEKHIIVNYNGVDLDYYYPLPPDVRNELKRKTGYDGSILILYTGGISKIKGFDILLRELVKINYKKEIKVIITGIGLNNSENIKRVIRKYGLENVIVQGWLKPHDLRTWYQISDLFILPSIFDSFSLSTLESMASGSVPIVSRFTGVAEIIKNGVNGFIVNPLQVGEIAEVLETLVSSSEKLSIIRERAIETAKELSWDNVARSFIVKLREEGLIP